MTASCADRVREYAARKFVEPARRRHDPVIHISVRDVHAALGLSNRFPLVCHALRSRKFLAANRLMLEGQDGPPSGQGSRVVLSYRLVDGPGPRSLSSQPSLLSLRGLGKEVFRSLGGGEAFIRRGRERFYEAGEEP
jgi:hypothetical protein